MEIKYQLAEKDYERLSVQAARSDKSISTIMIWLATPVLSVIIPIAMDYFLYKEITLDIPAMVSHLVTGVLVVIVVKELFYWYVRIKGRRIAKNSEPKDSKDFGDVKVVLTNYNKMRVTWDGRVDTITEPCFIILRETREFLLYDGGEEIALIVPKRVFHTKEEQTEFKERISKFIIEDTKS